MASYEQDKNKKWSVRFRIVEQGQYKQKRLSGFERKKDAEKAYLDYMSDADPKKHKSGDMTFAELYKEYRAYIADRLKASTIVDKDYIMQKHILPTFGAIKMSKISKLDLLVWQKSLEHYSYKYKTEIRNHFATAWKFGIMYYDICPCLLNKIEPFAKPKIKKEMDFWTKEEFERFIFAVDVPFWKTFFSFMYLTGCRIGEALALTSNDLFLEAKEPYIKIDKSVTFKLDPTLRAKGVTYNITNPKSKNSYRKVLLTHSLVNLLKEHKNDSKFLFGRKDKPISKQTIYRALTHYCKLSGVKLIRMHDFRHSHASLLINSGVNINIVANRLGHSVKETLETYNHFFEDNAKQALTALNVNI